MKPVFENFGIHLDSLFWFFFFSLRARQGGKLTTVVVRMTLLTWFDHLENFFVFFLYRYSKFPVLPL